MKPDYAGGPARTDNLGDGERPNGIHNNVARNGKMEIVVKVVTLASTVVTVATTTSAFRSFWRASSADSTLVIVGLACSPFVVGGVLALDGAEPNIQFTSIAGLLFYGFLVEIMAAPLFSSRAFRR